MIDGMIMMYSYMAVLLYISLSLFWRLLQLGVEDIIFLIKWKCHSREGRRGDGSRERRIVLPIFCPFLGGGGGGRSVGCFVFLSWREREREIDVLWFATTISIITFPLASSPPPNPTLTSIPTWDDDDDDQ